MAQEESSEMAKKIVASAQKVIKHTKMLDKILAAARKEMKALQEDLKEMKQ